MDSPLNVSLHGLSIQNIANCDVYVGQGIPTAWGRLFGGQTLGQSVMAACQTVADTDYIHSLHSYFILAGDSSKQIMFTVSRDRDGGSFKTRSVKAMQDNKTICLSQLSFHKLEEGWEYQVSLERLLPDGYQIPPPQTKFTTSQNVRYTVNAGYEWDLQYVKLNLGGIERSDWRTHCSLLTYLSDMGMVRLARKPLEEQGMKLGLSVSLDHSIHFHKPQLINVEDWMLFYTTGITAAGARATCKTFVFNLDHKLLATVNQEALVRPAKPPDAKL